MVPHMRTICPLQSAVLKEKYRIFCKENSMQLKTTGAVSVVHKIRCDRCSKKVERSEVDIKLDGLNAIFV